jgi:NAD-dependent deacetylase
MEFYNMRRAQLKKVETNFAHRALAQLETKFNVQIVTQNVDDLHERAGSKHVLHLHGELNKVRSTVDQELIYHWEGDLQIGHLCENGYQLRPHIVWFGEGVPMLENAANIVAKSDILIIIGTSLQVYPAASLVAYAPNAEIVYIDPRPQVNYELKRFEHRIIAKSASEGMRIILKELNIPH